MHCDAMNTMADLRPWIGDVLRHQPTVNGTPCIARVIGAEHTGSRNRDKHPSWITGVEKNRVKAQAPGARLPFRATAMSAQPGQFLPTLSGVGRAEQGRIFNPGIHSVGIV